MYSVSVVEDIGLLVRLSTLSSSNMLRSMMNCCVIMHIRNIISLATKEAL